MRAWAGLLLVACTEPLDLPADPSLAGAPVGVRTIEVDGKAFEAWYPAGEAARDGVGDVVDVAALVPASVTDHVGVIAVPPIPTSAVRDAPVRRADAPYPLVLFSHGFGGFRTQSVDATVHLASRGYVVVSTDHQGRSLPDLLPCLFSPALDGCDLSAFVDDPGPADLGGLRVWAQGLDDDLGAVIDDERLGVFGHSAGGASAGTYAQSEATVDAALAMAMGPAVARDVPIGMLAGACDATVPLADVEAGAAASADATLRVLEGAGHLAFSDICTLDLATVADAVLAGRDDLNTTFYGGLRALATDGCPGAAVPEATAAACGFATAGDLDAAQAVVRGDVTRFFDATLRGAGPGLAAGTVAP